MPETRSRTGSGTALANGAARLAAAAALLLAGCADESLMPPEPPEGGEVFERYVALGNSITAGFQSAGISDSTQRASYAVLLAEKMGTDFAIPALSPPGCPPPLVNVFTRERVAGASGEDCALRETPPPDVVHNVAVPGAAVIDALMNVGPETNANALTQLLLGGRTQLEAASDVRPTFASVWLGNNDVLGAALNGEPAQATGAAEFEERYGEMLDGLEAAAAAEGLEAVLVGVADVTAIPALSPGASYLEAEAQDEARPEDQRALPPNFEVDDSCAPSASGGNLVPFTYGFGVMIALAAELPESQTVTLDCADDRPVEQVVEDQVGPGLVPEEFRGISLLTLPEAAELQARVEAFNGTVGSEAAERGFAFFDPNPTLAALADRVPVFPNVADDPTTEVVEPVEAPFGPLFSRDGVHPGGAAHRLLADSLASAVNAELGTDLPVGDGG